MSGHHALDLFLNRLLLRSPLSGEEQAAIRALGFKKTQAAARTDVVSPGDTVTSSCLVAQGLVARFDEMHDGQRQITAFYLPGDMCDLHSVVAPTAAWGISALVSSTLLLVPHEQLREIAFRHTPVAFAFWRDGTVDASVLAKWIGNIGRQGSRARLAHLLCEFGMRIELAGLGKRTAFTLDATQEQLADALGLTQVHVNRTFQRLRAEGIVATSRRNLEVLDWERLVEVAEFDPAYLLAQRPPAGDRLREPRATSLRGNAV